MNVQDKLKIIQKEAGLTQTKLAAKIGVSFVALNRWILGKAEPREKHVKKIDALYLEYTGQKMIPESVLQAKKELLSRKSRRHRNILKTILENPDIRDQFLLSLTYNSNKIEGSTLSEDETADIMFRNRTIPDKSLIEQLEAKNHQAALKNLLENFEKSSRLDEKTVLKWHGMLMNGIRDDAGFYRRHGVRIVGSNVPTANYLKVPDLMRELFSDMNRGRKDILAHVSEIHARFEQVHPFSDGNGRIGRLILVAMLLKNNFAPAIIKQEDKRLYYVFLRAAQLKEDYSQLEDFICDAVSAGFDVVKRK